MRLYSPELTAEQIIERNEALMQILPHIKAQARFRARRQEQAVARPRLERMQTVRRRPFGQSLPHHLLIDAGLPQSAALIRANVESLGFRMRDVKLIVNSHAHYDHAGGIAELQRASGARVAASPWSAKVMKTGTSQPGDPQLGIAFAYPAVSNVETFAFEDTLRVGPIALVPHATGGHTPGGTSWSWRSCDAAGCLDFVYADSETPVSADDFLFTRNSTYPTAIADFERSFATLEHLSCDVLVTPHPAVSSLWDRVSPSDGTIGPAFVDRDACKRYAATARRALAQRVAKENGQPAP